jgi:hypothetical protein
MILHPSDDLGRLAWLTGFTGSNGMAVITQNDAVLWTDGRYSLQARGESSTTSKLEEKEKYSIQTLRETNLRPTMRKEQPPSWRKKESTASRLDVMVMQSPG